MCVCVGGWVISCYGQVGGAGLAVMDYPEHGPRFGADGLFVPLRDPRDSRAPGARRARAQPGRFELSLSLSPSLFLTLSHSLFLSLSLALSFSLSPSG